MWWTRYKLTFRLPIDMKILNFVSGKWLGSQKSTALKLASGSPSEDTLAILDHRDSEDRALAEVALEGARLSHEQVLRAEFFTPPERLALLQSVQSHLAHRRGEMATLIAEEVAKPITLAHAEVDRALLTIECTLQAAEKLLGLQPRPTEVRFAPQLNVSLFEQRLPRGPVFCITPFNFPLNLVLHKVAPALASGCPVVLKVASKAARVGALLVNIFEEAGVPAGMLSLVHTDNELTTELCRDPRIAHVSFTGSDKVGWALQKQSSTPMTLELGGNAAAYVHKDASLKKAATALAKSAFGFAGQSCISLQNLFVHQNIYDNFRALMIQNLHQLKWGSPLDSDVQCAWVIEDKAAERIRTALKHAQTRGAVITAEGEPPRGWTWDELRKHPTAVPPTLLENVPLDDDLVTGEIFGPVVVLHKVESEWEYYDWLKSTSFRLQTAVWSADVQTHLEKLLALDFGGVLINESPSFRFDGAAYGGRGKSGLGVEGPEHVIQALTIPKVVVIGR